jgi:hypothetical protein
MIKGTSFIKHPSYMLVDEHFLQPQLVPERTQPVSTSIVTLVSRQRQPGNHANRGVTHALTQEYYTLRNII